MVKPTFLLIGVQKGGTTSLMRHLNRHKDIFFHQGEMAFFSNNNSYKKGIKEYENKFNRGLENHIQWMKTNKNIIKNPTIYGEKTPEYIYNKKALERIKKYNPKIKLIVILREPISRAFSQWNMYQKTKNHELYKKKFKDVINEYIKKFNLDFNGPDKFDVIKRGVYIYQLANVLEIFPKDQLLILIKEEYEKEPVKTLNKIFDFLNVEKIKNKENVDYKNDVHKRNYETKMTKTDFTRLYLFYKEYNDALYKLLQKPIKEWEEYYQDFFDNM